MLETVDNFLCIVRSFIKIQQETKSGDFFKHMFLY